MSNKGFQTRSFDHRKQNNAGKISGNPSSPLLVVLAVLISFIIRSKAIPFTSEGPWIRKLSDTIVRSSETKQRWKDFRKSFIASVGGRSSAHLIHHPMKGQSTFHSHLKDLGFRSFQTRSFDHRKQNNAGKISGNPSSPLLVVLAVRSSHSSSDQRPVNIPVTCEGP
ncbi:hypothetical protein CEXT_814181 [Caerostris extrusa]|uniref:Transmembrane protein n=1 Tax=Caerostris extrusa TaxID=172846 RepID=A0AAV4SSZ6_CAEEX|nr:hypothetical protein CEXT_814181 [Caerostris extrusa]